ncbi:MAG: type II secretion system F family protein [Deltaproteobacteria bacterium]|nr:type II secretion system F family protein [Deltaproteobacteria bacterium]
MAKFAWEGTTREGQVKTGTIEASDASAAEEKLRGMQVTPSKVKRSLGQIEIKLPSLGGVKTKTLVVFTRQLSTMIDAGLPLVQCLDILAAQEPDRAFQKIVYGVKAHVEAGTTLADALKKYPKVFDELFTSMVAAGEIGGVLDTILQRLAQYLEKSMRLKQKVKSALRYPTFVLIAAGGIMVVLLWKVIPSFAAIFKSVGNSSLPALTQFVVNLSENFIHYLPYIAVGIVALIVGFIMLRRNPKGRRLIDGIMLKLPVVGQLIRKAGVARLTRTLGTLVASGVPILDALETSAKSSGNVIIESGIMYTRAKVAEGKNIAAPLDETKIFPKMVVQMIAVGESTGAMDVMLGKIADFYDDEVDAAVDGLTSLIEPMVMVLIGGMVGFVLIAMYLPIFGMAENLARR